MGIGYYNVFIFIGMSCLVGLFISATNMRALTYACQFAILVLAGVEVTPAAADILAVFMFGFVLVGNITALICILTCCLGVRIWNLIAGAKE